MTGKTIKAPNTIGIGFKETPNGGQHVQVKTVDSIQKVFGTKHPEMAEALMYHCIKALNKSQGSDDDPVNDERLFMVSAVAEVAPRDGVESMLAVQMATIQIAMVRASRLLGGADTLERISTHTTALTKLSRAYTGQMEALRKHRTGGKQTVTVQHVHVENGGQAIVGDVKRD